MKKILIANGNSDFHSGATQSLYHLALNIKKSDLYIPIIIVPSEGPLVEKLRDNNIKVYIVKQNSIWYRQLSERNSLFYLLKCIIKKPLIFFQKRIIKGILIKEDIDVIHMNMLTTSMAAEVGVKLEIPIVWHIREFMEEDLNCEFTNINYTKKIVNQSKCIIAISSAVKNKYVKIFDAPINVIYNGIYFRNNFEEKTKNNEKTIICILGRIIENKGQLDFVKAISLLNSKQKQQISCKIYGSVENDDYYRKILKFIEENDLKDVIKFYGYIDDVSPVLEEANIICVCSKKEAFGRVTIEAMMNQCVVIGSNTGGTIELITDNTTGFLYEIGDVQDLKTKIENVLNNDQLYIVAKNAKEYAINNFTAEINAKKIMNIYSDILF